MNEVGIDSDSSLHTVESVGEAPVLRPVSVRAKCSSNVQSTPEIEKKYVHGVYDAIAPHFSSTRFAKWPKVSAFLSSLSPGSLILDAGCGNGKYLGLNPDCFFIGCDISAALINICADKEQEVLVADAVNLPYRTGYGDAAISIAVLHHLSTESRRRKAVEELVRVVKKGGCVLITVWAREQEDSSLIEKWTPLNQRYVAEWIGPGSPRVRNPSSPRILESIPEAEENSAGEQLKGLHANSSKVKSAEVMHPISLDEGHSLPTGSEKNYPEQQEFFVPWHLPYHRAEVSGASAVALASGLAKKDDKKGSVVYNRYYHVFSEGELERLVSGLDNAILVDRFYDKSNCTFSPTLKVSLVPLKFLCVIGANFGDQNRDFPNFLQLPHCPAPLSSFSLSLPLTLSHFHFRRRRVDHRPADQRSSTPAAAAGDHHQDSGIRKVLTRPGPFHNLSLHLPASITTCYAVSVRPSTSASRNFSLLPPLSLIRSPIQQRQPFLAGANSGGSLLSINGVRLRQSSFAAVIGDTPAVSDGAINEETSTTKLSDSATSQETCVENGEDRKDASEGLDENKMIRVCDKLIEVFLVDKPKPTEWRRLLAFSKEWNNIRPHFYKRCQDRADSESDSGMKHKFLKLQRKLREVDDDVQRHNELLEAIRRSPSEVGDIVARRRKDFTKEFFAHLHTVAESYYDDPAEQNAVAKLGNMCLEAVEAYDTATESMEALNAAELKFQDIINSPSVDAACKKIDDLAQKNQLDSALMLMITKAWSAAKDSDMTKDEVKDVLYHLYKTTRGNLQRLMPKEIRILKYLLTIKDPEERMSALKDAFTPGEELEGEDVDCLYTTPEQLYNWIGTVLDAYNFSKEGTLIKEARDLMNPKIIKKMEELKKLIVDNFM
ncbi:hypothetical protein KY290_022209 [Solanum tuberosum]|uniref:Methyltransferase type 11 domain-containing protein n=1 Tax=Solanum tuberosum TaxID=4113 RepID=A0ABQ7V3S8_SOLTU|nr:hypothetical protein KY290_022209 [Solanum tuberosum]